MKVAETFMRLVNDSSLKWRPRRSLAFCHWDAEEYGLVGSGEWMQEMEHILRMRAVAIVNTDMAMYGDETLDCEGTPGLLRAMLNATRLTPNPNSNEIEAGRTTVYDSWDHWFLKNQSIPGLQPELFYPPGAGSDHYVFMTYATVPVISYMYANKQGWGSFYLYHSMYEIPWTLENVFQFPWQTMIAMSKITTELARQLGDSPVIPFGLVDYVQVIDRNIRLLAIDLSASPIASHLPLNELINGLLTATHELGMNVRIVQEQADAINAGAQTATYRQIEQLNHRLAHFEQMFQAPRGIHPYRPNGRHVVFTTSAGSWAGALMNCVREPAENWQHWWSVGNTAYADYWLKQTRIGFTQLQYSIESATHLMRLSLIDYN